jgi:ABC-type transporter Mla maintaining outer membrane lipid asymmetry permease subunit MlaE
VKWASRWDVYLYATDEQIHWFSMANSLMIVLFLSGMVAMIVARTLRRDLSRYNAIDQVCAAAVAAVAAVVVRGRAGPCQSRRAPPRLAPVQLASLRARQPAVHWWKR